MSTFLYFHQSEREGDVLVRDHVFKYAKAKGFSDAVAIEEDKSLRQHWSKRAISAFFEGCRQAKGQGFHNLVVYDALDIAGSVNQVIELLVAALSVQATIHFVKHEEVFHGREKNKLSDLIKIMKKIDSDFTHFDINDAKYRKALGMPLGRPKGSKNKSLKLDRYEEDILKYLDLGISKASIAKLVGCHPQTLYDWLTRKDIAVDEHPVFLRGESVLDEAQS